MSNKITATFGADVSEAEAAMLKATRATKLYEKAVRSIDGVKPAEDITKSLARGNEQIAKGLNLLKGGAIGMGVNMVIGWFQSFSAHAKEMGENATEAQKSAAKWGDEFTEFSGNVKSAGASVLGTLAGWGRSIGDSFRSPTERAYDEVAEASEKAADRQVAALEKAKAAHKKAAEEIPGLLKKLEEAQDEVRIEKMTGGDETSRLMTEQFQLEKQLAALRKGPKNDITRAEAIKVETELVKNRAALEKASGEKRIKMDEDIAAKKAAKDEAEKKKEAENKTKKERADAEEAERAAELAELIYDSAWRYASLEQKIQQAIKEGQEAKAKAEKDASTANLIALEKAKNKYRDLVDEAKKLAEQTKDAVSGELTKAGLTRGDDGKLRRGKVVVSEEDAARTIMSRRKAEQHTRESKRGEIETSSTREVKAGANALKKSEDLLASIDASLKPKKR